MNQTMAIDAAPPAKSLACRGDTLPKHFVPLGFECDRVPGDHTSVRLTKKTAGPVEIFEIEAAAHALHRLGPRLTPAGLYVVLQVEGESQYAQGGATQLLNPGDFVVVDASQTTEAHCDVPAAQAVLFIPLSAVPADLSHPMRMKVRRFDGTDGVGAMASEFLATFVKHAPHLPEPQAERLLRALADILSTASLSLEEQTVQSSSKRQSFHLNRILQYLSANLRDPDLTPTTIAAAHDISRRYLGKLFEGRGVSITRYVWGQRLDRCRRELEDPLSAHKQITQIAFAWGFNSASHFSRAFKERFGMSPKQVRAAALALAPSQTEVLPGWPDPHFTSV